MQYDDDLYDLEYMQAQQTHNCTRVDASHLSRSVLSDDDGMWHMWSAEMGGHCGIGAWLANSVVVHSTSKDPHGLYQRDGVVFPTFSHEPTVVRAPSGEFVMFFSSTIWNGHPGVARHHCAAK